MAENGPLLEPRWSVSSVTSTEHCIVIELLRVYEGKEIDQHMPRTSDHMLKTSEDP